MGKFSKIVDSIETIDFASDLLSAFKQDREINEFKKLYPVDGEIFFSLMTVLSSFGLGNFVKASKFPILVAVKRLKGFSMIEGIKASILVDPDLKLIQFDYVPNIFISEGLEAPARTFIGYLNEMLPGVKVKLMGTSQRGFLGRKSLDISFSSGLVYANMPKPGSGLIKNLLRNSLDYIKSIEKAAEKIRDLSTPEAAIASLRLSSDEKRPQANKSGLQIFSEIVSFLASKKFNVKKKSGTTAIFEGGTTRNLQRSVTVTETNQIIFETQLEYINVLDKAIDLFNVYGFIDYVNTKYSYFGKLVMDRGTKYIKYVTCVDVLGSEHEMNHALLTNMVDENAFMADRLFGRIRQMKSKNDLFGDAFNNFLQNDNVFIDDNPDIIGAAIPLIQPQSNPDLPEEISLPKQPKSTENIPAKISVPVAPSEKEDNSPIRPDGIPPFNPPTIIQSDSFSDPIEKTVDQSLPPIQPQKIQLPIIHSEVEQDVQIPLVQVLRPEEPSDGQRDFTTSGLVDDVKADMGTSDRGHAVRNDHSDRSPFALSKSRKSMSIVGILTMSIVFILSVIFLLNSPNTTATEKRKLPNLNSANTAISIPPSSVLSAGANYTCTISKEGGVWCWGDNQVGQLGDGSTQASADPVSVKGLVNGAISVVSGNMHSCAILLDKSVKCWGANRFGQLGDGSNEDRNIPVIVKGLEQGVRALSAGADHTCAITTDFIVACWGRNSHWQSSGQQGGDILYPSPISGLPSEFISVSAGGSHTCALSKFGKVVCWGGNWARQANFSGGIYSSPIYVAALEDTQATDLALGTDHSCALVTGGGVKCWGDQRFYQLGNFNQTAQYVDVFSAGVTSISANGNHTCVIMNTGLVNCWGRDDYGELGQNQVANHRTIPATVDGLENVVQIASGVDHSCAKKVDSQIYCWGRVWQKSSTGNEVIISLSSSPQIVGKFNEVQRIAQKQDSTPTITPNITPEVTPTPLPAAQVLPTQTPISTRTDEPALSLQPVGDGIISAGWLHTCAVTPAGGLQCWGHNKFAEVGNGNLEDQYMPSYVIGQKIDIKKVASGTYQSCALTVTGAVKCWGRNDSGFLGDGTSNLTTVPVNVAGLDANVVDVASGYMHSCAVLADGSVRCWGSNSFGQLGDGTYTDHPTPVNVVDLEEKMVGITTGDTFTCAISEKGNIKCWGNNGKGQLGIGKNIRHNEPRPVKVVGINQTAMAVSAGGEFVCTLQKNRGLVCWGDNFAGQLGNGTSVSSLSPIQVSSLGNDEISMVSAGGSHVCVLTTQGQIKCWGNNFYGQLGDGTNTPASLPQDVKNVGADIVAISAGGGHTCIMSSSSQIRCWGYNKSGQLGIGSSSETSYIPVETQGFGK